MKSKRLELLTVLAIIAGMLTVMYAADPKIGQVSVQPSLTQNSSVSVSNVSGFGWLKLSGQSNRLTIAAGSLLLDGVAIGGSTSLTETIIVNNLFASNTYVTNFFAEFTYISNVFTTNLSVSEITITSNLFTTNLFAEFMYVSNFFATNVYAKNSIVSNSYATNMFSEFNYFSNVFVTNLNVSASLVLSNLTAGRVPFVGPDKELTDDSDLTFATDTLTATRFHAVTSLEIPNGASPTVDAFGELAGDNDLWASGRGAAVFYDGTAVTALIGTLASDTPINGQVPKWNTGGTITWESDNTGSITGTDTHVMFFDGTDNPAGDAGFTYNKTTDSATLAGNSAMGSAEVTSYFRSVRATLAYVNVTNVLADFAVANSGYLLVTGTTHVTLTNLPASPLEQTYILHLVQDAGGENVVTFDTGTVKWPAAIGAPTVTTNANAWDVVTFVPHPTSAFAAAIIQQDFQ